MFIVVLQGPGHSPRGALFERWVEHRLQLVGRRGCTRVRRKKERLKTIDIDVLDPRDWPKGINHKERHAHTEHNLAASSLEWVHVCVLMVSKREKPLRLFCSTWQVWTIRNVYYCSSFCFDLIALSTQISKTVPVRSPPFYQFEGLYPVTIVACPTTNYAFAVLSRLIVFSKVLLLLFFLFLFLCPRQLLPAFS